MKTDTQAASASTPDETRSAAQPRPSDGRRIQVRRESGGRRIQVRRESGGRRIQVRRSGIHGKGVFALKPLADGETVIEYTGEVITWREAMRRHPHDPKDPNHTFYFHIDDRHVIDANVGGNAARWINHACSPNCEADEQDGRVFIKALRNIDAGEELFYDYGLTVDERYTPALKRQYACRCGTPGCRGTLLAPKR